MGKGDTRSKKGKISIGTYGKSRPHKRKNVLTRLNNPTKAQPKRPSKKK